MIQPAYIVEPPEPEDPDEADHLYEKARDVGPDGGPWSPLPPAAVRSNAEEE